MSDLRSRTEKIWTPIPYAVFEVLWKMVPIIPNSAMCLSKDGWMSSVTKVSCKKMTLNFLSIHQFILFLFLRPRTFNKQMLKCRAYQIVSNFGSCMNWISDLSWRVFNYLSFKCVPGCQNTTSWRKMCLLGSKKCVAWGATFDILKIPAVRRWGSPP